MHLTCRCHHTSPHVCPSNDHHIFKYYTLNVKSVVVFLLAPKAPRPRSSPGIQRIRQSVGGFACRSLPPSVGSCLSGREVPRPKSIVSKNHPFLRGNSKNPISRYFLIYLGILLTCGPSLVVMGPRSPTREGVLRRSPSRRRSTVNICEKDEFVIYFF